MTTQKQTQIQTQREVRSVLRNGTQPRAGSSKRGSEKAAVVAAIAASLKAHSFPSMDARLKNIVASQVGDLLSGGFALDDIRYAAVELGLAWDERRGHNRLTRLASRVRAEFWAETRRADRALRVDEIDPAVADLMPDKSMPDSRRNHPNNHAFEFDSSTSCRRCGGPPGVHVRPVVAV